MANAPNPNWPIRQPFPSVPMQPAVDTPHRPDNMLLKTGQPTLNGPVPMLGAQGHTLFRPASGVNGISSPSSSQGNGQLNDQFSGSRPPVSDGSLMNGPNHGQLFQGNQTGQSVRQSLPPPGGQTGPFRPSGPQQNVIGARPYLGQPPSGLGMIEPPQGPPGIPSMSAVPGIQQVLSTSSPSGITGPPQEVAAPSMIGPSHRQDRPNELPAPFHGYGQYSHQVGMALTPGITPANSGPPSQKSSRTNSPAVINPNLDALEGQFRGTPEQETQTPGTQQQWNQPNQSVTPPTSQPLNMPLHSFSPTSIQQPSDVPPSSQPGPPFGAGQSRFTAPTTSSQGMANSQNSQFTPPQIGQPPNTMPGQRPGFPPVSVGQQPGFPPMSTPTQRPGFPPMSATNQRPGFPPMSATNQRPEFPPMSTPNQRPGFPAAPVSASQHLGFPPPPTSMAIQPAVPPLTSASTNQQPGFPPPPHAPTSANQYQGIQSHPLSTNQQPAFPSPPHAPTSANQYQGIQSHPVSTNQQSGFPPPPHAPTSANQYQGIQPRPVSTNQQPGFPPPHAPTSANQYQGIQPHPVSTNQQPGFPQPTSTNQHPGFPPSANQQPTYHGQQPGVLSAHGKTIGEFVNSYPKQGSGMNAMAATFNNMSVQGSQSINLLQQKRLIPPDGVEAPKPVIPNDGRNVNCSPDVFRCTMNNIPQTSALLKKCRLPLGILIHPFKDLSQLPVIQSSVIVRCRSCRTYINPFVYFVDSRRWKCNLCYRVNELPDEFSFDPVSKSYGDPQRRPEIRSATIEFIAPSEYMLRPPQPAVYMYLIDVSFNAIETGYLTVFCDTLLDLIDRIPGDTRTRIGFIAFDSSIHFFNLAAGLSQPQMLTVTDVEDVFLPSPDDLLVNLNESKSLVIELLNQLPTLFENNMETRSALGAAMQAAYKMTTSTGGRVTVLQTVLPTYGPGALQNREDSTQKTTKDISSLGPATDFYKKLALDCSAQQIAVDLFMFNGQYADLASIECISKFSGGCVMYYPSYHAMRTPHLAEKFESDLRRYLTRKVGFESVMRIRCSKGISIHTFHGNFFVRSTDLLSLPNVNPDAGFGMQMSIEEPLTDMATMCFQAALLYTSSKGERRIRVHTLCLPVTNQMSDIHAGADQQAIVALLAKMAVDRSISSSMSDAREAIVNAAIDTLNAYGSTLTPSQRAGGLITIDQLRLIPLYCLALLKSTAFRTGISTKLDDRSHALHQCKVLPVSDLLRTLYPDLYPIHTIMEVEMEKKGSHEYAKLPLLQLSSANIDRNGAYLLDTGDTLYLYLGSAVSEQFCQDMLDKPHIAAVQEGGITELPELENEGSDRLRGFISHLYDGRPNGSAIVVVREDGKLRMKFFQHFVEDRTESSISYVEFLQQIQVQVKS